MGEFQVDVSRNQTYNPKHKSIKYSKYADRDLSYNLHLERNTKDDGSVQWSLTGSTKGFGNGEGWGAGEREELGSYSAEGWLRRFCSDEIIWDSESCEFVAYCPSRVPLVHIVRVLNTAINRWESHLDDCYQGANAVFDDWSVYRYDDPKNIKGITE